MTYVSEVMADTPLAYWRMEETPHGTQPTLLDSSGNARHAGVYQNRVSTVADHATLEGVGSSSWNASLSPSAGIGNPSWMNSLTSYSVEVWIKTTGNTLYIASMDDVFYGTTQSQRKWGLLVNSNGKAVMRGYTSVNTVTLVDAVSSRSVNDGQWHHLVGTTDGTTLKIYVDGVLDGSQTLGGPPLVNSTVDLIIGACRNIGGTAYYFNGQMDEFALYSGALSPSRIAARYAAASLAVSVVEVVTGYLGSLANGGAGHGTTFTTTPQPGDVVIVTMSCSTDAEFTSVSGLGGTWEIFNAGGGSTGSLGFAICKNAVSSGVVTSIFRSSTSPGGNLRGFVVRGLTDTSFDIRTAGMNGASQMLLVGPRRIAPANSFVLNVVKSNGSQMANQVYPESGSLPSPGAWTVQGKVFAGSMHDTAYRLPTASETVGTDVSYTSNSYQNIGQLVMGPGVMSTTPAQIEAVSAETLISINPDARVAAVNAEVLLEPISVAQVASTSAEILVTWREMISNVYDSNGVEREVFQWNGVALVPVILGNN